VLDPRRAAAPTRLAGRADEEIANRRHFGPLTLAQEPRSFKHRLALLQLDENRRLVRADLIN
jgi:hypothetical protein